MLSPIHDHDDAHCFMKILEGEVIEAMYAAPPPLNTDTKGQMKPVQETTLRENSVSYINSEQLLLLHILYELSLNLATALT